MPSGTYYPDEENNPFMVGFPSSSWFGEQQGAGTDPNDTGEFYYGGKSTNNPENYFALPSEWAQMVPPGSQVRIYNPKTGQYTLATHRDLGPGKSEQAKGIFDMSPSVFKQLGLKPGDPVNVDFSSAITGKSLSPDMPVGNPQDVLTQAARSIPSVEDFIKMQDQTTPEGARATLASVSQKDLQASTQGTGTATDTGTQSPTIMEDGSINWGHGLRTYQNGIIAMDTGNSIVQYVPGMDKPHIINTKTSSNVSPSVLNQFVQYGISPNRPDGKPFATNAEAIDALNNALQDKGIPNKAQQHVIDQVVTKLNSSRNGFLKPYLTMSGNYESAMNNINKENRNGVDDALLISSYYGIERPGYAPTEADLRTLLQARGITGELEVKGKRLSALTAAVKDLINGKSPSEDTANTLNAGRILPDYVLPQMQHALDAAIRPRYKQYEADIQTFRNQLTQAGIKNPDLYIPELMPGYASNKPEKTQKTEVTGKGPISADTAYQWAQEHINDPDANLRDRAEKVIQRYQNLGQ